MNKNKVKVINVKHSITRRIVKKLQPLIEKINNADKWTWAGMIINILAIYGLYYLGSLIYISIF